MSEEIKSGDDDATNEFIDSIFNARANAATPPQSSEKRIPKVRGMVGNTDEYEKYYVPKVVSIGPYHYGKEALQLVQNLKPRFVKKLFEGKRETLRNLYKKLLEPQKVNNLRSFYDEDSMPVLSDTEFTNMMLLDSCFIFYFIELFYSSDLGESILKLKSSQIVLAHQDMFLLENQIPFKVLTEVAQVMKIDFEGWMTSVINDSSIVIPWWPKRIRYRRQNTECYHLLHVHLCFIPIAYYPKGRWLLEEALEKADKCNYRNVSELVDVGIHFKPSSTPLDNVEFSKGWLRFSASVKLPRIKVNGSTKQMLLNLIACETCLRPVNERWVTSYVHLLDSLIDNAEDVKILRKSWVLETSLGSDEEVAKLFNEIGRDLESNTDAYSYTKYQIQKHYESWRNTLYWQLKNEYFKSPWAIFVLLGALIALFLSAASTYYTRWSPKGECDDLCNFLKINHHL